MGHLNCQDNRAGEIIPYDNDRESNTWIKKRLINLTVTSITATDKMDPQSSLS